MSIPLNNIVKINPSVVGVGNDMDSLPGLMLSKGSLLPFGMILPFSSASEVMDIFGSTSEEYQAARVYFSAFTNASRTASVLYVASVPQKDDTPAALAGYVPADTDISAIRDGGGYFQITINGEVKRVEADAFSNATSMDSVGTILGGALGAQVSYSPRARLLSIAASGGGGDSTITYAQGRIAGLLGLKSDQAVFLTQGKSGVSMQSYLDEIMGHRADVGSVFSSYEMSRQSISIAPEASKTPKFDGDGICGGGLHVTGMPEDRKAATVEFFFKVAESYPAEKSALFKVSTVTNEDFVVGIDEAGQLFVMAGVWPQPFPEPIVVKDGMEHVIAVTYDTDGVGRMFFDGTKRVDGKMGSAFSLESIDIRCLGDSLIPAYDAVWIKDVTITPRVKYTADYDSRATPTSAPADSVGFYRLEGGDLHNYSPFSSNQASKLDFAAWVDSRGYDVLGVLLDSDEQALVTGGGGSIAEQIEQRGYQGTACIYGGADIGALVAGTVASLDFGRTDGRYTLAFRSNDYVTPSVDNERDAVALEANGYNFYGSYASASGGFRFLYPGRVSGRYLWIDSYICQMWMRRMFQSYLINLLTAKGQIPYNVDGSTMISAALQPAIDRAVNFGAIRGGVMISDSQKQVLQAQGVTPAQLSTLQTRGWYLLVDMAHTSPQTRARRGSPPIYFWYTDGQSVQRINMNSIEVQ